MFAKIRVLAIVVALTLCGVIAACDQPVEIIGPGVETNTPVSLDDPIIEGATLTYADAKRLADVSASKPTYDPDVWRTWMSQCGADPSNPSRAHCRTVWSAISLTWHGIPPYVAVRCSGDRLPSKLLENEIKRLMREYEGEVAFDPVDIIEQAAQRTGGFITIDVIDPSPSVPGYRHVGLHPMTKEWQHRADSFNEANLQWESKCDSSHPCATVWSLAIDLAASDHLDNICIVD